MITIAVLPHSPLCFMFAVAQDEALATSSSRQLGSGYPRWRQQRLRATALRHMAVSPGHLHVVRIWLRLWGRKSTRTDEADLIMQTAQEAAACRCGERMRCSKLNLLCRGATARVERD